MSAASSRGNQQEDAGHGRITSCGLLVEVRYRGPGSSLAGTALVNGDI